MRRLALALALALPACGSSSSSSPAGAPAPVTYARDAAADRLRATLGADGYDVDEGSVVFFQIADCAALPTCFGNNPSSPYGLYLVPPAPGEAPLPTDPPPFSKNGHVSGWRMRADEAIVFLGRTAPPARYLSFRSYLFSRAGKAIFASLGDSLNHLVLGTDAPPGGDAFDRETIVITTADATLDAHLRARLAETGASGAMINTDVLPASELTLGLDDASDVLTMLYRVALVSDAAKAKAYFDAPPARLLRVRPRAERKASPLAAPPPRTRGTGVDESAYAAGLDALGAAIKSAHPGAKSAALGYVDLGLDGATCIGMLSSCNGDNSDTVYETNLPIVLGDAAGERIVVYGVDHTAIGKATYTTLGVYDVARLLGVGGVADEKLAGSAAPFFPAGDARAASYFAYSFARSCDGEPFCFEVPVDPPGVSLASQLAIVVRPYLEPATRSGPLKAELLLPRGLHLTP